MLRMPGAIRGGRANVVEIYNKTLSAAGRFDVAGIPQGYFHIQIKIFTRSNVVTTGDSIYLLHNGDSTAANYRYQFSQASGAAVSGGAGDLPIIGSVPAATADANYFGLLFIDIFDYADSALNKLAVSQEGNRRGATDQFIRGTFHHWENTAAINQITIQPDGYPTDEFVAGSRLQIWLYR